MALLLAAVALLASACGSKASTGTGPSSSPTAAASPRPSTSAHIAIITPSPGQTVTGATLHVQVMLTGATLVPPGTTQGTSPTEGHIHLSLDGSIQSMTGSLTQDLAVTPGPHLLTAEFVANDHGPFDPRALVSVRFTDQ